jgi:CRP-like cAMP-binding protein
MKQQDNNLRSLFLKGKRTTCTKGEVVQATDDKGKVHYISEGYIKRYMISNKGELGVQLIYGPGDIFSLTEIYKLLLNQEIYTGPETYYYEAMCDVEMFSVDTQMLEKAVTKSPILYRGLMIEAGKRLRSALNGLENVSQKVAYKKVAHRLWYYSHRFGKKTMGGIRIQVPLTQQDLADILGLTRETVSLCIAQLRKEKLIKTGGKQIIVTDQAKLQEAAFN